jgi:hypothetical protein
MLTNWLNATEDGEWQSVNIATFIAASVFVGLVFYATTGEEGWVPLLDSANLAFHEAGHPIFGLLLGERITVYGGTMGQLVFPLVATISFLRKRETLSFALALAWLYENLLNIARYMADARAQLLPLVGNGEHDWTEIFSRWGVLEADTSIAGTVRLIAWFGLIATWLWLFWRCRAQR